MMTIPTRILKACIGMGAVAFATEAHALGPVDLEVAAKAGVASKLESGGPDPLGFGIGGRAGVSVLGSLYAGLMGMYYVGSSQSLAGLTISGHAVQYGLEAGYNIYLLKLIPATPDVTDKLLTLRPQVGVGNLTVSGAASGVMTTSSGTATTTSADQSNLYIEPGLTALVAVGPLLAGLDVNVLWVPGLSNANVPVTAHAQLGLKF